MKKMFTRSFITLSLLLAGASLVNAQNIYWGEGEGFNNNSSNIAQTSSLVASGGANFNGVFLDTTNSGIWALYNAYVSTSGACAAFGANHIRMPKEANQPLWISTPDLGFGVNTVSFLNASTSAGKVFTVQYTTGKYADNDSTSIAGATWTTFGKFKISAACGGTGDVTTGDTTVTLNQPLARRIRWYIDSTAGYQTDFDSVVITSTSTIVPVTFTGISANYNSGIVKVSWSDATELNTANYQIERSADGKNFTSIGSVSASNARSYTYYDNAPISGNDFYRVVGVDNNGSLAYSTIVSVTTGSQAAGIIVAPNPVTGGVLNLQLNNLAQGTYTVNIFNSESQKVYSTAVSHAGGNSVQTLSLPFSIGHGVYNVNVTNGSTSFNKSIIIE